MPANASAFLPPSLPTQESRALSLTAVVPRNSAALGILALIAPILVSVGVFAGVLCSDIYRLLEVRDPYYP